MKKLSKFLYFFSCFGTFGTCFSVFSFLILTSTSSSSNSSPQVWNLSDANPVFVGREKQLKTIHSFFIRGKRHVLALTGGPGFGKTQIAKEYAQKFSAHYDLIWWFDAQQDLPSQFKKLAIALNQLLPEQEKIVSSQLSKDVLVDAVKNVLRVKNIRYLLIFDNPQTYAQIQNFLPCTHDKPRRHVLLTSRNANIWIHKVEIGAFERPESLQFIQEILPKKKKEEMVRLAEALSDYPMGLTLAVEFIDSHPTSTIDKYLSMHLKKTLKKRERNLSPLFDQYPQAALSALELSLDAIEEKSKDSLQALFFICLLNSKDIPESYIDLWLKKASDDLTADETIKHIYDQSLIGVSEITEFTANKKPERKRKERKKEIQNAYFLSMHDLIHQMINEEIPMTEKKELIEKATEVMLKLFSGSAEDMSKRITNEPIHLLHAQKLCANAKEVDYSSDRLLQLKICILQCVMTVFRDFDTAEPLIAEIEKDIEAGLPLTPYYAALFKINKGFFEHNQANHDFAIRHMTEGMDILSPYEEYKGDHLRAITNLIQYHAMRGELEKAGELIAKGKKIFNSIQSTVYKCFFIYAWAMVLNDQGRFQQALDVITKANIYPMLSTEYPPMYHGLLQQQIEGFLKLGKLEDARKALKEFEKKLKEFYAKENVMLAYMLILKSIILVRQSHERPQALKMIQDALEVCNKSFQGTRRHRAQGRAYLALGKAHVAQNDFSNALNAYLMSDKIYTAVLKNKEIDDVSDLYRDIAILGAKMRNESIVHEYLKAHIQIFGRMHPRTKEILLFLNQNGLTVPL